MCERVSFTQIINRLADQFQYWGSFTSALCFSSAGSTSEAPPPAPPLPDAQPIETKAPEEEMDVVDDDITTGMLSVLVIKVEDIRTNLKVDTFPVVDGINMTFILIWR